MKRHLTRLILTTLGCGPLVCAMATGADTGKWRVTDSFKISRPSGPASLSSVTWISNATYLAATDWEPTVWELTLPLNEKTGKPRSCSVKRRARLEAGVDVEGLAVDPLDPARILAADEFSATIRTHDVQSGKALGELKPTGALAKTRTDMGLESLALSRDGLQLWTANEEAVEADGPISDRTHGSDVRLAHFTRADRNAPWQRAGEWLYRTDPIAGGSWKSGASQVDAARSGVSDLCLLHDGTLLVLEREFSVVLLPRFRCRIYETDFSRAEDVSKLASTTNASVARVEKRLLHEATGLAMYEGLCEGPRLTNGGVSLVMVSDGDGLAAEAIKTLRLDPVEKN